MLASNLEFELAIQNGQQKLPNKDQRKHETATNISAW